MTKQQAQFSLKVVTVDDSPIIAERLQTILDQIEQVVFAGNATNIATALALIEREQPQVVVLDINLRADLPMLNGINLLIMLRKKYIGIKIIMLTNLTHEQYRNTCLVHGADYFLDKSNEFDKIAEIVGGFTPLAGLNILSHG
ncbi:MAG: response regulator transcription factor [Cyclobacteriaceae bacterium]|nr:response regulator transcription factor [Cyclobacteriaceae bacterium]